MASFFSSVRQGFGRQSSRSPSPSAQSQNEREIVGQLTPSPTLQSLSPVSYPPSLPSENNVGSQPQPTIKPPYFFRDENSEIIVTGNFMTLAIKPAYVEEGEWVAHQVIEQYRLLDLMVQMIRVIDEKTGLSICNPKVCPTMSASTHEYYWTDKVKQPVRIPASQFVQLVQKWIVGKISDPAVFPIDMISYPFYDSHMNTPVQANPTDLKASLSSVVAHNWLGKSSGFPQNFRDDIRNTYRQMMQCYAHLYHGHWINPFWHVNAYRELNTCFVHFINVGIVYDLISDEKMELMQPLINLWRAKDLLPASTQ